MKLAQCRSESISSINDITKALELLEECDHSEWGVTIWHVNALITRCELYLLQDGDSCKTKELREWAKEMQDMYDQLLQVSNQGEYYPEMRGRILQVQEKIEL